MAAEYLEISTQQHLCPLLSNTCRKGMHSSTDVASLKHKNYFHQGHSLLGEKSACHAILGLQDQRPSLDDMPGNFAILRLLEC